MERLSDKTRFVAALVGGQSGAMLGLVLFGGAVAPMLVAFIGSAAVPVLLARRI